MTINHTLTPIEETAPPGVLLLSQPEQIGITHKEMIDALPERYWSIPHVFVDLDMADLARQAIQSTEWTAARRELERRIRDEFSPLRAKHPDYRIVYFGSSPIPLAVHLGHLLETWQQIDIVPHHHIQRTWGWRADVAPPRLAGVVVPTHVDRTPGEAVIRVSTSHSVDPQLTRLVVPSPLVEIDIALEQPAEDAFPRVDEMIEVARRFRDALDAIGDRFPGVQRVHLFAAVQPGVAVLLGAQINERMHPPVQTYQYTRKAPGGVFHLPAVLVNAPAQPEPAPLTDADRTTAARDREVLTEDLDRFRTLRASGTRRDNDWLEGLLLTPGSHPEFCGQWRTLPTIESTPLFESRVDQDTCDVEDSFRLGPVLQWQLDDRWLASLARRIEDADDRRRALRLLVLHEAGHRGAQRLTRTSSQQIGRFPKVLEAIDYHVDVWAMLHERALSVREFADEGDDLGAFVMGAIRLATETMWAFDEGDVPLDVIQVRRLNRYLIWYWQYLVMEVHRASGANLGADGVLAILAHRPLIELAGPPVRARDERVFFDLEPSLAQMPELAVYHDGKLHRHGPRYGFDIAELLRAVRERDANGIIDVLRGAVEQIVR